MRFREFSKFIIKSHLFENKQQYKQIMDTMVNADIISQEKANNTLKQVKSLLKRADRIIWWLRWWRIKETGEVIEAKIQEVSNKWEFVRSGRDAGAGAPQTANELSQKIVQLENLYQKITKKGYDYYQNRSLEIDQFQVSFSLQNLENHWSTMFEQSPQINEIKWEANLSPIELRRRLEQAEEKWKQKQKQELEPEPDDQIIIDYGKYAWVKLDRAYCSREGSAMGHCGNTATPKEGDRILSFRTKVNDTKQKPHLTFILDKDGYLGEMKGRANEKPSEKYHPYIIDLLQKDFVKGIKGGGYMSDRNFSVTDLEEEQMNALISEKPTLLTPEEAYLYAMEENERKPELEDAIAKDPEWAHFYARDVIKGRFPAGEDAIARDPEYAYEYAVDVIKGRWPAGEDAIAKDPMSAYSYALDVIKGRWPAGEDAIAKAPKWALDYALDVIKGRFPAGEDAIAKDPEWAYFYARRVIKKLEGKNRWPAGEDAIARHRVWAFEYALRVIKGRWPEPHRAKAEANIKQSANLWEAYVELVKQSENQ